MKAGGRNCEVLESTVKEIVCRVEPGDEVPGPVDIAGSGFAFKKWRYGGSADGLAGAVLDPATLAGMELLEEGHFAELELMDENEFGIED